MIQSFRTIKQNSYGLDRILQDSLDSNFLINHLALRETLSNSVTITTYIEMTIISSDSLHRVLIKDQRLSFGKTRFVLISGNYLPRRTGANGATDFNVF